MSVGNDGKDGPGVILDLNQQGLVRVIGENGSESHAESNGAGKSAISSESILWVLTGDTNKDAKTIINSNIKDKNAVARVKLELSIDKNEYVITRDSGNHLTIIKNGTDISGNTYTKSKEILAKELGYVNKEILTSIIILGQGMNDRFSKLKASERKSRLEYFVGVDALLANIQTVLDGAEKEINSKITEVNLKRTEQNTIISSSKELINKYSNLQKIDETDYKAKVKEYNAKAKEYNELKKEIDKLKSNIQEKTTNKSQFSDSIAKLSKKVTELNKVLSDFENKKSRLNDKLKDLQAKKEITEKSECPTCHQHLQNDELEKHIKEEIEEVNAEINQLNLSNTPDTSKELNSLNAAIAENESKATDIQKEINELSTDVSTKTVKSSDLYKEITELDVYLKECEKQRTEAQGVEQIIKDSQDKINSANRVLEGLTIESKKYNTDKDIQKYFKNSASRKFRNFLLEGVFNYVNSKLETYSKKLFDDRIIKLESNGSNIDIRVGELYFEDISGGEQQKTNLAIQFALRDLARTQRGLNINYMVLDEVLDGLDSKSIECVLSFIDEISTDVSSMFVISHKNDFNITFDSSLMVKKGTDNITTVSKN